LIGQVVEAGGTTPIVVTLRTGDGGRQQGDINVYFKLPDGTVPEPKHISIRAHAIKEYELSSRSIDFGVVTSFRPVTKALLFRSRFHNPIQGSHECSPDPGFPGIRHCRASGSGGYETSSSTTGGLAATTTFL
jgi:hypothetical protein